MSKILVDTIDTRSGTTTLTLGSTNAGTIALGSGDVQSNFLYPAFEAYPSADQNVTTGTFAKVVANTERFDTDSCYDNSTNYRFTPTSAGKYFCYLNFTYNEVVNRIAVRGHLYKNGSVVYTAQFKTMDDASNYNYMTGFCSGIIDFNGSTDYLEFYTSTNSGVTRVLGADSQRTYFGAYRIGS